MRRNTATLSSVLLSIALLLLAVGFSTGISIGSFRQSHTATVMNSLAVAGGKAADNVEQAIRYGKPLDDFYGIERFLGQVKASLPQASRVTAALADGRVLYDERGRVDERLGAAELRQMRRDLATKPMTHVYDEASRSYRLFLPIRPEAGGPVLGAIVIAADGAVVREHADAFARELIRDVAFIAAAGIAALALLAFVVGSRPNGERLQRNGTLAVIAAVQVAAAALSYGAFRDAYVRGMDQTTGIVARILRSDIEGLVARGVTYDQLHGVDEYLKAVNATVPHFSRITLERGEAAGAGMAAGATGAAAGTALHPLARDATGAAAAIGTAVSEEYVSGRLRDILLDSGAILLTSLMFMFEMSLLLTRRAAARQEAEARAEAGAAASAEPPQRMTSRFLAFLMYFGLFMSASFVPLVMGTFDEGFFGLSGSQAAAVPVTVEMAFGAVAIFVAGTLIRRVGWFRMACAGGAMTVAAAALAFLAETPAAFVAARALTGVGSMVMLVGVYGLIATIREREQADAALPHMLAGMNAGVNCGAITGALLAAQIGYQPVFAFAAAILGLSLLYAAAGVPKAVRAARSEAAAAPAVATAPGAPAGRRWGLGDASVIGFFLLISIPTSAASMFLPYFFPVYAASLGEGANVIGRAFLLNGLCWVFLGPWLAGHVRRRLSPHLAIALSAAILCVALVFFSWQGTLVAAFAAVLLIGVADSFGSPAQSNFVASLPIARRLGRASVQAYQLNARKLGQAVGPVAFSAVAAMGVAGVGVLGMGLAMLAVVFLLAATLASRRLQPA